MGSERMSLRKIGCGALSAVVLALLGVPSRAADVEVARTDSARSTFERNTQNATTEIKTSSSRSAETQERALPVAPVVNRRESSGAQESTKDSGKVEGQDKGNAAENSAAITELESHRQKLMELRNLLKSELLSIQRDVTYQGSSRARHVPELDRLQEDLHLRSTDRETRVKRMREQVSRLEELLRGAPACQPELPTQDPVSAETPPLDHIDQQPDPPTLGPEHQALPTPPQPSHRPDVPASDHGPVSSEHTTTTVATPAGSSNTSLPNALHERLKEDEHSTGPTDAAQSVKEMITATTITDHPIDRVGLANNLYGTGRFSWHSKFTKRSRWPNRTRPTVCGFSIKSRIATEGLGTKRRRLADSASLQVRIRSPGSASSLSGG